MSPPRYFNISYEINPWMKLENQVDTQLAEKQWQALCETYQKELGWRVELIEPQPNLPDMVFTANGGLCLGEKALVANFRHFDRQPESAFFKSWFEERFAEVKKPRYNFEGEGDGLLWGDRLLLGYPWRSDQAAHAEIADYFQKEVISLQLTDARFYHLDTCLTPLNEKTIALYPPAFSSESLRLLKDRGAEIIEASKADALAYGLNACCDEKNIVIPEAAKTLIEIYKARGLQVWPLAMSEFKKSGGGVKCLTLELH